MYIMCHGNSAIKLSKQSDMFYLINYNSTMVYWLTFKYTYIYISITVPCQLLCLLR